MLLPEAFLGLFIRLILISGVEGEPNKIFPALNTSGIHARPPITAAPDSCCFVVQDRLDDYYWRRYTYTITEIVYAITKHVSIYPTGKITDVETNIYSRINSKYRPKPGVESDILYRPEDPFRPPAGYRYNQAAGPEVHTTLLESKDGTKIVTAGTTIFSPTAFNVYNSIKIITVPAVTDSNGNAACVTNSWNLDDPANTDAGRIFTGMNSWAQAYYGGLGTCVPEIVSWTQTIEDNDLGTGTTAIPSVTSGEFTLECIYTITGSAPPSVVTEISFTKPYIRLPPASETIKFDRQNCEIIGNTPQEMWGYLPQDVIDFIISNPYYSSQYPEITRCFPGAPFIIPETVFRCEHPQVLDPQPTLTSYEERTVTIGSEFFPTTGGGGSRIREPAQVDTTTTAYPSSEGPGSAHPNPTHGQPTETDPPFRGSPSDNLPVDDPPKSKTSDSTARKTSDTGSPQDPGNTDPSSLSTLTTNPGRTQSEPGNTGPGNTGPGNIGPATDTIAPEPPTNFSVTIAVPQYFYQLAAFISFFIALLSA